MINNKEHFNIDTNPLYELTQMPSTKNQYIMLIN